MKNATEEMSTFERTWSSPSGITGWLSAVNNQPLGKRFMVTAFIFFLLGGVLALLMRIQLAVSDNGFLGPQVYNQFFTMHGSTMMFLFAVPFLEGLALYILPLMIGSRDVAYPRLSAFSYWTYLFGGVIFYFSFFVGTVPDAGWFSYAPLSGPKYSGLGMDFWVLGLGLVEIAGIATGIEIAVTVLKMRAPGMAISRMPLFAWAMLVVGVMIIFAFTTLLTATFLLELDRAASTRFFDTQRGGSSLLWQHLFWFFGHPEVYIVFLPATGIVSMIVSTFARRRIAGYVLVALAILLTGFLSFGLWVHHMFTTGLPEFSFAFFTAASLMIAVASGTQVFAWIATLWGSGPSYKTPLLFVLGFLVLFVLGGLTGVMVAVVPFDIQVHDTFFVVAHFHYVLIGGAVFPIMGGLYYWIPKITGRMLDESLGKWSFWLIFIGFNLTFFPMHVMGMLGMPRRVYTYPASLNLDGYNLAATAGSFVLAAGFLVFVADFFRSQKRGEPAGPNPWRSDSLEWSMPSPPPVYGFFRPPTVGPEVADFERASRALAAAPERWRATLVTDAVTGKPQMVQWLPGPTLTPGLAAVGLLVAFSGVLVELYLLTAASGVFTAGLIIQWLWSKDDESRTPGAEKLESSAGLTVLADGSRSTGWWGMVSFVGVMATVYGALFFTYFYLRLGSREWPQGGIGAPGLLGPGIMYSMLVVSAIPQFIASRAARRPDLVGAEARKNAQMTRFGLLAALGLSVVFLILKIAFLSGLPFSHQLNAYASVVHAISWVTILVVVTGIALNFGVQTKVWEERMKWSRFVPLNVQVLSLYWYFMSVVSMVIYGVLFLEPHLL